MTQEIINKAVESWLYQNISALMKFFSIHRRVIFLIYIIFIIITIAWIRYTRKTILPIQQKANRDVDSMRYLMSKILYQHKLSIHNLPETIPLLLHYKTDCILHNNPRTYIEKLYEEYQYICQLTNEPIQITAEQIISHKDIIIKLQTTEKSLQSVLGYGTLGISLLLS